VTSRLTVLVLGALAATLLAGCGEAPAGPAPVAPPSTPTGSPRPATLPLNSVDPCKLLTDAQLAQLKVGAGQFSTVDYGGPNKGPSCAWLSPSLHPGYTYTGFIVLNRGVGAVHSQEPPRTVDGFAAVTTGTIGTKENLYCQIFLDVAPDQALSVAFDTSGRDPLPGMTHQAACDRAQQAAELMLGNLRAQG
jgi:hypothetical protein